MMKITNRKFNRDHSKKECSRTLWGERKGRAGRGKAMNEKQLFCFCGLCMCGNKRMFKVNREVLSTLKQYLIMASATPIRHSSTSVTTYLN
jgi:hypothetical protein